MCFVVGHHILFICITVSENQRTFAELEYCCAVFQSKCVHFYAPKSVVRVDPYTMNLDVRFSEST